MLSSSRTERPPTTFAHGTPQPIPVRFFSSLSIRFTRTKTDLTTRSRNSFDRKFPPLTGSAPCSAALRRSRMEQASWTLAAQSGCRQTLRDRDHFGAGLKSVNRGGACHRQRLFMHLLRPTLALREPSSRRVSEPLRFHRNQPLLRLALHQKRKTFSLPQRAATTARSRKSGTHRLSSSDSRRVR